MTEQKITLKKVTDLRVDDDDQPIRYRIPAYQRGYRWESQQVTQLLEDIRDFTQRESPQPEEFYCLQPLVLRLNDDGAFEVVDGQQRLTTLLLILRHFNDRLAVRYQQRLYSLEYETRPGLVEFLERPSDERAKSNIDFFHIAQAVKTIETWFESRESEVEAIKSALINQAKVIWFQLAADEDPVDAFTRLNVGKIPLSNGELIRALFLRRSKNNKGSASSQLQIALEWDQLEKALQDNEFWCFLSNDTELRGNRIGFLFDLIAREDGMRPSTDAYATFYYFSKRLNDRSADIEKEWLGVKRAFMQLEEWFKDRRLYHLVGFLIWAGMDVNDLRKMAEKSTKRDFKESLRAKILERTMKGSANGVAVGDAMRELIADKVETLEYGKHNAPIRAILLLFNLATLVGNKASNLRFQFEGFKTERWDIEHVRSVASARPLRLTVQREWLMHCQGYLTIAAEAPELLAEIAQFMGLSHVEATDVRFEVLYEGVLKHFQELDEEDPDNSIANLVLLDANTNRSYKNAVFAVKRQRVLALDRDGIFVPLCTRNAFLKCYSSQVKHAMFWTQADGEGYRMALVETLQHFFEGEWVHE
ncbi:MAG: hypothetical protein A3J24_01370 [Deltaproteobacteria bacterium RIFCSPLOWO2_02_FULL_53_8]|nr:MAG: hypothetical protein A3J24_01370 [Deltaproteobacteria bacterium RIFCSPLOWO2_02_FULL_53_8]